MNLYPPAPTTIVFAGIPIGVAYAQEPPITHAISTALGSAPIPCAIDRQIGTIRAVVAVFDIKFVKIQQRINTTNVSMYGDGFSPSVPITLLAISSPAPVSCKAAARESVPPKRKIVLRSLDLSASFSEITPVRIRSSAQIPPEIHNLIPILSSKIIANRVSTRMISDNHCFHAGTSLKSFSVSNAPSSLTS